MVFVLNNGLKHYWYQLQQIGDENYLNQITCRTKGKSGAYLVNGQIMVIWSSLHFHPATESNFSRVSSNFNSTVNIFDNGLQHYRDELQKNEDENCLNQFVRWMKLKKCKWWLFGAIYIFIQHSRQVFRSVILFSLYLISIIVFKIIEINCNKMKVTLILTSSDVGC